MTMLEQGEGGWQMHNVTDLLLTSSATYKSIEKCQVFSFYSTITCKIM